MKIIDLAAIRASLELDAAISAVRAGFIGYSAGRAQLGAVGHLVFPEVDGDCHIKSAAISGEDVFAVKIANGFPRNAALGLKASDGMMMVFDTTTGAPLALLQDEGHLTDLRTAIAGGLAASLIKPENCEAIGIIGTGIQGRLQAELAARLTGVKHILIWGRDDDKASELAATLRAAGLAAEAVADIAALTRRTRLVITTTPARIPLLTRANTVPGMRIVAVGADAPGKQEVETELVAAMDLLVADDRLQCVDHGELSWPAGAGLIEMAQIAELGSLLAEPPILAPDSAALVDLTGIGVQDLAVASTVWRSFDAADRAVNR
ncbi:MAG: hypothetical protein KYX64_06480 [Sphingopyxis sp.]|nr:hypothetical protein [Sphingopyxis sp.]